MQLPIQSLSVMRHAAGGISAASSISASCGPANTGQGQCFDANGPIGGPGAFNCAACCARRGAIHWQGLNGTVSAC